MSEKQTQKRVPTASMADQAKNGDASDTHAADHGPLSSSDNDEQWKIKGGKIGKS